MPTAGTRRRTYPANIAGGDANGHMLGDIECETCVCKPLTVPSARSVGATMMRGLAVLMLGQRQRLLFDSVPPMVINASVQQGYRVGFFAYLENETEASTYIQAQANYHPHPVFGGLSDEKLYAHLSSRVVEAGGHVGKIVIGPRPSTPTLPLNTTWHQFRMWGFSPKVRRAQPKLIRVWAIRARTVLTFLAPC